MQVISRVPAKSGAIYAVVHRADGKIEDLGLVSYWHRNPVINWGVNFYIRLKDFLNDRSRSR